MLMIERIARYARLWRAVFATVGRARETRAYPTEVLTNRDEFHLGRDDAALCIMHLRHAQARLRAQRRAAQCRKIFETPLLFLPRLVGRIEGKVAIVDWLQGTSFIFFNVTTSDDPIASQRSKPFAHISRDGRISIRSAGVVNTHRRIVFKFVPEVSRRVLIYLTKRHAHTGLLTFDVDAAGIWKWLVFV